MVESNVLCWIVVIFFFFQAEDGIRDTSVTGVQTCALPIVSNSLGAMPRGVADRLAEYVDQWAELGVRAWAGSDGWWQMPVSVGDEIAPLIGAGRGEIAMLPNVTIAQTAVISARQHSTGRE